MEYSEVFTYEQSLKKARMAGLDVVLPASNELFIDIDTEAQWQEFLYNEDLVNMHAPDFIISRVDEPSKSGLPRRHVTTALNKEMTDVERIGLQAIFGSDRRREMLSYLSWRAGHEHPTLFFEAKQKALPPAPESKGLLGTDEELQMACDHHILTDADCPF